MSTIVLPQAQPKITRPSTRRIRREEIHAHWIMGQNATITIGTSPIKISAGENQRIDLGGLIITLEVPEQTHVL